MCKHSTHSSDCKCDNYQNLGRTQRILIEVVIGIIGLAVLIVAAYYLRTVGETINSDMVAALEFISPYPDGYVSEMYLVNGVKYMSAALGVWFSITICLLVVLGQWIWSVNLFRIRDELMDEWKRTFIATVSASVAVVLLWIFWTFSTGGYGPLIGAFIVILAAGVICWKTVSNFYATKPWMGVLAITAAIGCIYLATYASSAESPLKPSINRIMHYVSHASVSYKD